MSWQYRVMRIDGQLAIHEVHYDGNDINRPKSYSEFPTYPRGESLDDLFQDFLLYKEALNMPVLLPEDFGD